MFSPDRNTFHRAVASGANLIPLAKSWPADLETPLTAWIKVGAGRPPGVLLESIEGGETLGRWSVIASDPLWTASARGNRLVRRWRDGREDSLEGNPLESLRTRLRSYRCVSLPGLPPLGQIYGMWGYELIRWVEPSVPVHPRLSTDPPDGIWMMMDAILIFDQVKRQITAVAFGDLINEQNEEKAWQKAMARIERLRKRMDAPLPVTEPLNWSTNARSLPDITSNRSQAEFETAINTAKNHITAGDVFQLVISQRFETQVFQSSLELYRSLRMVNPSPYMAFFDFGDWQLIGSSPEAMVQAEQVANGIQANLRPIAGTRPRGETSQEDSELEVDLLADPKERAEHVMLVDLGRNDLGRVCRPGSVFVKDLMVVERYSHVMHIVSQVEGRLDPNRDVWDLLMASFPAGTVSGAPKIRAMQLIYDLEPDARGPYSGVYGSVDLAGALNTAITIRTMVVQPNSTGGCRVKVQAGAGVVADSKPTAEFEETLNKARAMLTALACLNPVGL
ncbi:chorismate-binding protein [Synechococcus sp. M16CYN]|uniref:anthranilate synthase component I family protein n=1 Tax=Synechococcus sp. M16CYN TaxID=3103139 RepID=UPI00324D779B